MCVGCGVRSDAPVVGAPIFDALLDLFTIEVVLEGLLGQRDDFVIGGKTEADELIFRELVDLGVPLGGGAVSYTHLDVYKRQFFNGCWIGILS